MDCIVDEQNFECHQAKQLALKVTDILEEKTAIDRKSHLLPLQGDLWLKYGKLLKREHSVRENSSLASEADRNTLSKEKVTLRREQADICNNLSPFMREFCNSLMLCDAKPGRLSSYFLHWLQLGFDKNCRLNLPDIRAEYNEIWAKLQKLKAKKEEKSKVEYLQKAVTKKEVQMDRASLGLEHLFRELGQMYEAITESKAQVNEPIAVMVKSFPKIVAKLLLAGHPLELIDGDTSNVPITWLKAVLSELANILGKKKLFVLSVLGIQSSGKSTLLNTMFGLRFAVSAGRCTRGAFIQLVPLRKESQRGYDYVVVVDTEGLRAPELGRQKYDHDNALATLVIGLGDATIMNIKGENTAEIKDVLQIVIHAFLRMKMVNKHLNTNQTCVFIHQNVPAINAKEKMKHGCQKLQENLDQMTAEAAQGEGMSYKSFSEIIKFDVEKHVWYFSELWRGSPPMAPASPDYSRCTQTVKTALLSDILGLHTMRLEASDFYDRVKSLWDGIPSEDFVFSFRNSLEVKAYNAMQTEYSRLEWDFQKAVASWIQKTARINIKTCNQKEDLEIAYEKQAAELLLQTSEQQTTMTGALETYFETCELRDVAIQWKEAKKNALKAAAERIQSDGEKHLCKLRDEHSQTLLHKNTTNERKDKIKSRAVQLADELRGEGMTESEQRECFERMWNEMVNKLVTEERTDELSMVTYVVKRILQNLFMSSGQALQKELLSNKLQSNFPHPALEGSMTVEDISGTHFHLLQSSFSTTVKHLASKVHLGKNPEGMARRELLSIANRIYHQVDVFLTNLLSEDVRFFETHAQEILLYCTEGIKEHNDSPKQNFNIMPTFTVKLAVNVCRYSIPLFCQLEKSYTQKHSMRAQLEDEKPKTWHLFENALRQSREEVIVADLFCDQMKREVEEAVHREIETELVDKIITSFDVSKWALMIAVMEDLAEKDDFSHFSSYIRDAKTYVLQWITNLVNKTLFDDGKYKEWSWRCVHQLVSCVTKVVEDTTTEVKDKNGTLKQWIEIFGESLKKKKVGIVANVASFTDITGRTIENFDHLCNVILGRFDMKKGDFMANVLEKDALSVKWSGKSPARQIMDKLWGCPKQCPFCKEPCNDHSEDHLGPTTPHMCIQHRPEGVGSVHWKNDGKLLVNTCNYTAQTNATYLCSFDDYACRKSGHCNTKGTDFVWHSCRECGKYLPEWSIPPSASEEKCKYWKWFMATYAEQLKEEYGHDLDIPEEWNTIEKEEAVSSLKNFN